MVKSNVMTIFRTSQKKNGSWRIEESVSIFGIHLYWMDMWEHQLRDFYDEKSAIIWLMERRGYWKKPEINMVEYNYYKSDKLNRYHFYESL